MRNASLVLYRGVGPARPSTDASGTAFGRHCEAKLKEKTPGADEISVSSGWRSAASSLSGEASSGSAWSWGPAAAVDWVSGGRGGPGGPGGPGGGGA